MITALMSELAAEYREAMPAALIQVNSANTVSIELHTLTAQGPTVRRLTLEFDAQRVKVYDRGRR